MCKKIILLLLLLPTIEFYLWLHSMATGKGNYYYVLEPNLTRKIQPSFPGYNAKKNRLFKTNNRGLRGAEIKANDSIILFVGGSTTLCLMLDNSETWSNKLVQKINTEKGLKLKAQIAAQGGFLSDHYALLLEKLLPTLQNVKGIILLPGGNDLEAWNKNEKFSKLSYEKLLSSTFRLKPLLQNNRPLWFHEKSIKNLLFYNYLRNTRNQLWNSLGLNPDIAKKGLTIEEKQKWRGLAEKVTPDLEKKKTLKDYINNYETNLFKIVKMAKQYKIPLFFVSQPILYKNELSKNLLAQWQNGAANKSYSNPDKNTKYYIAQSMYNALHLFNLVTQRVAKQSGSVYIDMENIVKERTDIFYDQWHFNSHGAEYFADVLAKKIKKYL